MPPSALTAHRRHESQEIPDNLHNLQIIQPWYGGPLPGTW